jgi:hypothetical protein
MEGLECFRALGEWVVTMIVEQPIFHRVVLIGPQQLVYNGQGKENHLWSMTNFMSIRTHLQMLTLDSFEGYVWLWILQVLSM